jgi:curli production assembly/transport component CsgG
MKKTLLALIVVLLSGCAVIQSTGLTETDPTLTGQRTGVKKEFDTIPSPSNGKPVSVAVYSFADKTGQRRPQPNVASLSTAVTQGAETFLIQALQGVGRGQWFDVVERVGIDNLVKERTIIKQMREAYEGNNAKPLMPMQFAGIIMEGGIVGYDTTTTSGGAGMRIFGIGKQTQWSTDTVTISLRAVSVNTGKVLAVVTVQKTILSTADSATALKFFDQGTQAFEAEMGLTINEPGTYAVKAATEMAVVELIKEGQRKGIWEYKTDPVVVPVAPIVEKKPLVISSEIKKEEPKLLEPKKEDVNVEEKKDVVVQPQTKSETKTEAAPSAASEVKKEEKTNVKPISQIVPTKNEGTAKKEETKVEPKPLFGQRKLKDDSYLYSEENTNSTRKWQFKKGTVVDVRQLGTDGWLRVRDSELRGGWIRQEQLE